MYSELRLQHYFFEEWQILTSADLLDDKTLFALLGRLTREDLNRMLLLCKKCPLFPIALQHVTQNKDFRAYCRVVNQGKIVRPTELYCDNIRERDIVALHSLPQGKSCAVASELQEKLTRKIKK